jgi:hypothetical protein
MLLKPLSALLQRAFSDVSIGGIGDIGWLRDYGVSTTPLAFGVAVPHIMEQLAGGLRQPLDRIRETLAEDVLGRLDGIDRIWSDLWYLLSAEQWDEALKYAQFLDHFDDEAASTEYRELIYKITEPVTQPDGRSDAVCQPPPADPVFRQRLLQAKAEYEARSAEAASTFEATFRLSDLEKLRRQLSRLNDATSETELVMAYQELDRGLTSAEDVFLAAQCVVDESMQHAIDLASGR